MLKEPKVRKRYSKTLKKSLDMPLTVMDGVRRRYWATPKPLKRKTKQIKATKRK